MTPQALRRLAWARHSDNYPMWAALMRAADALCAQCDNAACRRHGCQGRK